jgi:hypothetical protein
VNKEVKPQSLPCGNSITSPCKPTKTLTDETDTGVILLKNSDRAVPNTSFYLIFPGSNARILKKFEFVSPH